MSRILWSVQGRKASVSLFNLEGTSPKMWGFSSAGRAPALQAGGQRFDPANLHQKMEKSWETANLHEEDGPIAQLARAHD